LALCEALPSTNKVSETHSKTDHIYQEAKSENISVNAIVTGSFSKPKVSTDIKEAIANFVTSFVKQQKQKLLTKGASLLEDLINKNNKSGDTTKTKKVVNQVKDLLNGLFGKKKTP